jgi:hypothetical protein
VRLRKSAPLDLASSLTRLMKSGEGYGYNRAGE